MKFDFTYEYLWKSVSLGNRSDDFTNFYKDAAGFVKCFKRFQEWIDFYTKESKSSFRTLPHMHPINGDREKIIINKIIKKQHEGRKDFDKVWMQRFSFAEFWQLGLKNGFRIIGIFTRENGDEIFTLLILDVHHLLSPDKNYNDENYQNNKFSVYYK
ncbi:MAG: hypothetical protein KIG16_02395, partial [Eubacteriales bacterium]|nr:hypothetical protein [Eubacteriales bacterium]